MHNWNKLNDGFKAIENQDTSLLEKVINYIDTSNEKYLNTITDLNSLTDEQIWVLKNMPFKRGSSISGWNFTNIQFNQRWEATPHSWAVRNIASLDSLDEKYLKYMSKYCKTKWQKANGKTSTKKKRGENVKFAMDDFSLQIFKNSIKKPFLRTEGKTLITKVNLAFKESERSFQNISTRNKFYKLILDNTEVHTKAMINEVQTTELIVDDIPYLPKADEYLAIRINPYVNNGLKSYSPGASMDEYSTDLTVVTGCKLQLQTREQDRMAAAASIMTSMYVKTEHEPYLELAKKYLEVVNNTKEIAQKIKSAALLYELVKEDNENRSNETSAQGSTTV